MTAEEQQKKYEEDQRKFRATGRTTRQIDAYIQLLFKEGRVEVKDHHGSNEATRALMDKLMGRLDMEHNVSVNISYQTSGSGGVFKQDIHIYYLELVKPKLKEVIDDQMDLTPLGIKLL